MSIVIYGDEGASPLSLRWTTLAVRALFPDRKIHVAKKETLTSYLHNQDTSLLIMPGGRDIPYERALRGEKNVAIRTFVEAGGGYLGFCAGAYYGAGLVEFEEGHPLEVIEERQLKFYPGKAVGPVYEKGIFSYENSQGEKLAWLKCPFFNPESFPIYYHGGCGFPDVHLHSHVDVIAHYDDLNEPLAAIVQCQVGKGRALLSGVHPEYSLKDKVPKETEGLLERCRENLLDYLIQSAMRK